MGEGVHTGRSQVPLLVLLEPELGRSHSAGRQHTCVCPHDSVCTWAEEPPDTAWLAGPPDGQSYRVLVCAHRVQRRECQEQLPGLRHRAILPGAPGPLPMLTAGKSRHPEKSTEKNTWSKSAHALQEPGDNVPQSLGG